MEVNVLRKDGKDVHYGMAMIVQMTMEDFFGKRELLMDKHKKGFTFLRFDIADDKNVKELKKELKRLNPLYKVEIV